MKILYLLICTINADTVDRTNSTEETRCIVGRWPKGVKKTAS